MNKMINPVTVDILSMRYDMSAYACLHKTSINRILTDHKISGSVLTNSVNAYRRNTGETTQGKYGILPDKTYQKLLIIFNLRDTYKKPLSEEAKKPKEFSWVDALVDVAKETIDTQNGNGVSPEAKALLNDHVSSSNKEILRRLERIEKMLEEALNDRK